MKHLNFKTKRGTAVVIWYTIAFVVFLICLIVSIVNTRNYNNTLHRQTFSGPELFSPDEISKRPVSIKAIPRDSTWSKVYDPDNLGLTEHNIQAYTYDFTVSNNTGDEVKSFTFRVNFNKTVFLSSAWNGALEFHQNVKGHEVIDTIPDLREYNPDDYKLETITVDGETCIPLYPGDYLVYVPSSSMNAMEIPIKPYEGTTPGVIMYVGIDESIEDSVIELDYKFHKIVTHDTLFWISVIALEIWFVSLIVLVIVSFRIRRYQERHERDNELISESIETFTGFIDAKDSYTNGHSKRVAYYTRLLAKEFGYKGDDLDRIYYIALLHDCGKIGVPDAVLNKPGRLTDDEFNVIKSHTVRGGEILKSFKSLKDAEMGALYHHEKYDGSGYPEGKAGEDIPFVARMICVADSFDAMNSNRVYRNSLTKEKILSELEENKGRQFDPEIAEVMLKLIKNGTIKMTD